MPKQSAVRRHAATKETLTIDSLKVSVQPVPPAVAAQQTQAFADSEKRYITDPITGVERPVRQPSTDAPPLPEGGHAIKFVRFSEQIMLDMQRNMIDTVTTRGFRMRLIGPLLWIEHTAPGNGKRSLDIVPVTSIAQMKAAPEAASS